MVLLMEEIVSLLQSQFDYSTDSCHSGTEVTLFHVIIIIHNIQPYHIITIHHLIIHFQQKHGCFPQLSYPISQQKTGCAGETGWSSTTGGWWIQWDGSLGRVEWGKEMDVSIFFVVLLHKVICLKVTNVCLICWEKNVVSVFRLIFFWLKRFVIIVIGQILKSLIFSLGRLVQMDSCLYMAWRVQLWHEYTTWMLFLVDVHLFTNHASFMAPVQDVKNTDWDEICRLMYSAGRFTVKEKPHQSLTKSKCWVWKHPRFVTVDKHNVAMWQTSGDRDNKVFNGMQCIHVIWYTSVCIIWFNMYLYYLYMYIYDTCTYSI